jgi:hypothetical protein
MNGLKITFSIFDNIGGTLLSLNNSDVFKISLEFSKLKDTIKVEKKKNLASQSDKIALFFKLKFCENCFFLIIL